MTQKYTEAKKEGNRRWDAANLDRLSIALPKGNKEVIKSHAEKMGESVNGFIGRAINSQIERDNSSAPPNQQENKAGQDAPADKAEN